MVLFPSIRSHERQLVAVAFFTLLVVMLGHAVFETARDALFLSRIPARQLPWVYLAIAAISLLVQRFESRIPVQGLHWILAGWMVFSSLVTLAFWFFLDQMGIFGLYALYVWSGLMVSIVLVHFWSLLGSMVTVSSAKRIFAVIGAGSGLGAILGSGVAVLATSFIAANDLLLITAAALFLATIGPAMLARDRPAAHFDDGGEDPSSGLSATLKLIVKRPYIWRLAALVLVSTVTVTFVDIVFKAVVVGAVQPDRLAHYFSVIYLIFNSLSLVVQLFVVQSLIRRLSVSRALMVLPSLLLTGTIVMMSGAAVVGALFMKAADGALRHSLHRTSVELLYVPLTDRLRRRVKTFIDVVGQRGGQAFASVVLLMGVGTDLGPTGFVVQVTILSVVWLLLAWSILPHYLDLFRRALSEDLDGASLDYPDLDVASLESLVSALSSSDDARVTAALRLLEEEGLTHVVPVLLLYHPSAEVVTLAIEAFVRARRVDFLEVARRIEPSAPPLVQAAILVAITSIAPDRSLIETRMKSKDVTVRAVASILSYDRGWTESRACISMCLEVSQVGSLEQQVALVHAIRSVQQTAFEDELIAMARGTGPEVRRKVVDAMAFQQREAYLGPLRDLLGDRQVREDASCAIRAYGHKGFEFLVDSFRVDLPRAVRWQLPRAIGSFETEEAAQALLAHLVGEDDGLVRYRIVRELEGIRMLQPRTQLDRDILTNCANANIVRAYALLDSRLAATREIASRPELEHSDQELLISILTDKESNAIDLVLRQIGLLLGREDFAAIIRGVRSNLARQRASSLELLENVLSRRHREAVLALVDDRPDIERVQGAPDYYQPQHMTYESLLERFLGGESETLQIIAVHLAGELNLGSFIGTIKSMKTSQNDPGMDETIALALEQLKALNDPVEAS